jgi:hypothetical protein
MGGFLEKPSAPDPSRWTVFKGTVANDGLNVICLSA